jgi:predicted nuclease of predicted toxin-antitoxin system
MRLLLDQGLPHSAAELLRALGWDVQHTSEVGLASAKDAEILAIAKKHDRTVITLDADFHALLALNGDTMPSVVRIRIEGLRAEPLVALLLQVLPDVANDLEHGAMLTITDKAVRIRRLWRV